MILEKEQCFLRAVSAICTKAKATWQVFRGNLFCDCLSGMDDEDHLAAAAFNVLGAMLMENTTPEMNDLPLRTGKKTFDYFE